MAILGIDDFMIDDFMMILGIASSCFNPGISKCDLNDLKNVSYELMVT